MGAGTAILLKGWCYHPERPLKKLEVLLDGKPFPVSRHSLIRFDMLREREPELNGNGNPLNSGFSVVLPLPPADESRSVPLSLRATFVGGLVETGEAGSIDLLPGRPPIKDVVMTGRVGICLLTRNPDALELRRQLASIAKQTHSDWVCVISDDASEPEGLEIVRREAAVDARFLVALNDSSESSYSYLQTALLRVAKEADFVAIAEQGDVWNPEKLKTCLQAFTNDVGMVHCQWEADAEDRHQGSHAAPNHLETIFFGRPFPCGSLVFRRSVLDVILPFPPQLSDGAPEDWIGMAAMAAVESRLVEQPLYRPAREPSAPEFRPASLSAGLKALAGWMDELMMERSSPDSKIATWSRNVWIPERASLWSTILSMRCGRSKEVLARWSTMVEKPSQLFAEARKESGHAWTSYFGLVSERALSTYARRHREEVQRNLRVLWGLIKTEKGSPMGHGIDAAKAQIDFIPQKIAPLNLSVSPDHPRRINIVTSTIDFRYLFGGYFAVFSLALKLSHAGYKVRLILTDPVDYRPNFWKHEIKKYHGLTDFFDHVEVQPNYERQPVESNPRDQFIATSWWTAFAAHSGAQQLGLDRFIYLSQDFEPFFYPASSFYALALQSYGLPHYAIFSTEFLREYSRVHGHGVFAEGREKGDANSTSFPNAIKAPTPKRERLERRGKRRMLVYSRPEDHANRNCFQLAALGLIEAIKAGHFSTDEWEFHGIGSVQIWGGMKLAGRAELKLLPKVSLEEYYNMLPDYDIGLSLMLTPHPSLVPLDMAASGIVTVTNSFDIKTKEKLQPISTNLVVVPPTIDSIRDGLIEAATKVNDIDARMKGTKLNWPRSWDEAFNDEFMKKLLCWIDAGIGKTAG